MIKRFFLIIVSPFFTLIFLNFKVEATSGCCSWHGGVCGCDTIVGTQICCDGTYSSSCTCVYIPENYFLPKPAPTFSPSIQAQWWFFSNFNETWDIKMKLLDNNPTKYSAVISKCAGCDPGPLVDFYSNNFYFKNIAQGKWYVNLKKEINSVWSNIVYWEIDVPEWQTPTPTSFPVSTFGISSNNYSNMNELSNNKSNSYLWLRLIIGVGLGSLLARYVVKK